jgi:hypothetical protein
MLQIPTWILTALWGLIAILLATIGYLIRFVLSANQRKNEEQDYRIGQLEKKFSEADRKFVETERDSIKQFVDRETWTRDYVTITARVDAVFKKLDRMTE